MIASRLENLGEDATKIIEDLTKAIDRLPDDSGSCSMKKRWTTRQLIHSFCQTINDAHDQYRQKVEKAIHFLALNVRMAQKLDGLIGSGGDDTATPSDEDERVDSHKAKDGSVSLRCPVSGCSTRTFKLKRHIDLKHTAITPERANYAVMAARKMEINIDHSGRDQSPAVAGSSKAPVKQRAHQNTEMVSRRHNYKRCLLCSRLVLNLSEHVTSVHKITRQTNANYDHYVSDAPCFPKNYTKLKDGVRVLLEGEELEEAQRKYGGAIGTQQATLDQLKDLRSEMAELHTRINDAPSEEGYVALKGELEVLESKYKEQRYKDSRTYCCNTRIWHDSFLAHLQLREHSNPKRGVKMALDILLPYEASLARPLVFNDLMNGVHVRKMLFLFKDSSALNSSSKQKYVAMFDLLLEYLYCDVESPENVEGNDIQTKLLRDSSLQKAKHEITVVRAMLSKMRGKDLARTREAAQKKLVSEDELDALLADVTSKLTMVLADSQEVRAAYSMTKILDVRNNLIAAGTLRLGRRSKELMKMETTEVDAAERLVVDGDIFHVVKVHDQKNSRTGDPAPVTFSDDEFSVLKIFLKEMRPKIIGNKFEKNVFPPREHMKFAAAKDLSYSSACKILQSFETLSGKKLTSRSIRGSKITSNRDSDYTEKEKTDLAKAMSHSVSTADRYYNYRDLSDSVHHSLSISKQRQTSTPIKETARSSSSPQPGPSGACSPVPGPSGPCRNINYSPSPGNRGVKRKILDLSDDETEISFNQSGNKLSSDDTLDKTLLVLRGKKVCQQGRRTTTQKKLENQAFVDKTIREVVAEVRSKGMERSLYTNKGDLSVQPIKKKLPKEISNLFSNNELRDKMKLAMS